RLTLEFLEDRTTPSTITVTTLNDVVDGDVSSVANLQTTPGPDGVISLREAIDAAETDATADTINFDPSLAGGTIHLTNANNGAFGPTSFEIATPITIDGSGQILSIDGEIGQFRFFGVTATGNLTLENLELTGGQAIGGSGFQGGGGAAGLGGAIFNMGTLTVRNSTLDNNTAFGGNAGTTGQTAGGGGGIGESATGIDGGGPNAGTVAGSPDGGFGGGGAAASELSTGNGGFGGGGGGGAFGLSGGNGGFGGGGGGTNQGSPGAGGAFANNGENNDGEGNGGAGAGLGGAIFNLLGTVNIVNSTLTNNAASGGFDNTTSGHAEGVGGGVFNLNGTLSIVNSTLDANAADIGGAVYNYSQDDTQGIPTEQAASAKFVNSIFEDSTLPDGSGSSSADEVHNTFQAFNVSAGALIASIDASAPNITNQGGFVNDNGTMDSSGLVTDTQSSVQALTNNGGLTPTMALAPASLAVDAGSTAKALDPVTNAALSTDQRGPGFSRVGGASVDLGAFELLPTVNIAATSGTADENTSGSNLVFTITRDGNLTGTLSGNLSGADDGLSPADIATTAAVGGTFNFATGAFQFAAGSDTITVTLVPVNDVQAEADESVTLTLPAQDGLLVGKGNAATLTIAQNDFVVTNTNDSGEGSLRQAILNAEQLPNPQPVTFLPALAGQTISLFTSESSDLGNSAFDITGTVVIDGSGEVLANGSEASSFRFFFVEGEGDLTLENLELKGGTARGADGTGGSGGNAGFGGAIFNQGTLTIRNSTLDGNEASGGSGSGFGSGSGSGSANEFGNDGGFGEGGGFGIVDGGFGGFGGGGGGFQEGGSAGDGGFGAENGNGANGGAGAGMGGAVFNFGGTVDIINSTLTGNIAQGGDAGAQGLGGGFFNLNGTAQVVNSTFAANNADAGGSLYNFSFAGGQGVEGIQDANATLANSIFVDSKNAAGASSDEVHNAVFFTETPALAEINTNAIRQGPDAVLTASAPNITNGGGFVNDGGSMDSSGVITATKPVVSDTLADNGGLTKTLALAPGSEAIDAGNNADAVDTVTGDALTTDQRGGTFPRIINNTVDLGAFESAVAPPGGKPDTIVLVSPTQVIVQNGPVGAPNITTPFPGWTGEKRVTVGDVNNDGTADYIFTAGAGGGPQIEIVSGKDGTVLFNFFAYDSSFRGGVFTATADVNGDGFADIVTGAGIGGGPHVRVFSGKDGSVLADFFAYDPSFRGGVSVAAGDVTGDGTADIVTGPGPGGGSQILVIDGTKLNQRDPATGQILPAAIAASFFAFDQSFQGGAFVGVGNLDGDKFADIVVGPLTDGSPQAVVFTGAALKQASSIFAQDPGLRTGLRFALADTNGDGIDELVVVAGPGGGPQEVVIDPLTGQVSSSVYFTDPNSRTGFDVG
ncbi:MAG TPA: choice-of-anchor Q domain-containing protein, partial [Urbifossiella sp.]|nr:choice-of-anchor Q domain-containing protein [Urbifossiella sp.]